MSHASPSPHLVGVGTVYPGGTGPIENTNGRCGERRSTIYEWETEIRRRVTGRFRFPWVDLDRQITHSSAHNDAPVPDVFEAQVVEREMVRTHFEREVRSSGGLGLR